ncbi:MAG TPA: S49 family peptidase, partial [bacterium]|nr:S49 family peptidase [bacterium]
AVVLRVDSPGGDGLASDLVAEAMKRCAGEKPVIVSQGSLAASGGYWLSMYADTVVAAPYSLTGSIGVIGGWVWNKGLGEKLGLRADHVQVGDHADLGFGIQLPLLGVQVPDRNLTPEERDRMEMMIRAMYEGFVGKVAAGRGISPDSVGQIAQGRVWSGLAAQKIGLVDVIGGMEKAIALAREAAGIPAGREIAIVEYPRPALFDFSVWMPRLLGSVLPVAREDAEIDYLKKIARHPGQPLPLLTPEYYVK